VPTIAQAITEAAERLLAAGVSDERRTASSLLCHALGVDRTYMITRASEELDEAPDQAFRAMIARRAAGEPLQYITGHQEFYGLDFKVTPEVLIPRPETEFLVEQVIKHSHALDPANDLIIVDAGTGSGCIAITLAVNIKKARLLATDISPAALRVARENAQALGAKIEFFEGDLLAPLAGRGLEGAVDFLVSNPPYIAWKDAPTLQREVREWEPHSALFADQDGLKFYQRLLDEGQHYVKRDGLLVCEIGYNQLDAIKPMIDTQVWRLQEVTNDLQDIPRILTIRKGSAKEVRPVV
jgi:release factor glutamine methyltransferase